MSADRQWDRRPRRSRTPRKPRDTANALAPARYIGRSGNKYSHRYAFDAETNPAFERILRNILPLLCELVLMPYPPIKPLILPYPATTLP
jgi:hypothetical protein